MLGALEDAARAYDETAIPMATVAGPDHRLVACNAAYQKLSGSEEALGRTPLQMWPDLEGHRLVEILDRVRARGEPAAFPEWRYQVDRGTEDPEDCYVDLTAAPFRVRGRMAGIHVTLVDVTAQARRRRGHPGSATATPEESGGGELDVVAAVQDELLPGRLPLLPDLDVAASYALAAGRDGAGGDWFDCVPRPDGSVALVVGDVVGRGVAAAATMGQLRAVLQDHLLAGESASEALEQLSRFARLRQESHAATACVVVLDRRTGRVEYSTAGHPPPLVVRADGLTTYLTPTGGGPLATGGDMPAARAQLEPGDLILLYTDGVVTRPHRAAHESTIELAHVTARAAAVPGAAHDPGSTRPVARVAELALALLFPRSGYDDDSTLLAGQRVAPPQPLRFETSADAVGSQATRRAVAEWLRPLEADPIDVLAVLHVVGELVTNAAEHAYGPGRKGRPVTTALRLEDDGSLSLQVSDRGSWRAPAGEGAGGRGLGMVRAMADGFDLEASRGGTTVSVQLRVGRSAQLLTHQGSARDRARDRGDVPFAVEVDDERVRVCGPLDLDTAEQLLGQLYRASGDGARCLDVDLAGITHLASAGVQVLHELIGAGVDVRLRAPYGSVAQHVLELVRLPYDASVPPW